MHRGIAQLLLDIAHTSRESPMIRTTYFIRVSPKCTLVTALLSGLPIGRGAQNRSSRKSRVQGRHVGKDTWLCLIIENKKSILSKGKINSGKQLIKWKEKKMGFKKINFLVFCWEDNDKNSCGRVGETQVNHVWGGFAMRGSLPLIWQISETTHAYGFFVVVFFLLLQENYEEY